MIDHNRKLCLLDTNILLRLSENSQGELADIVAAMRKTRFLCYCTQTISEFWNVSTRGKQQNGLGLSVKLVSANVRTYESNMRLLPDGRESYLIWRELVEKLQVTGKQVHDAKLAAVMLANAWTNS